uniref:Uncharacterized protein n=1 Tax=Zooxanthella nutricula TaxID=1333877 RepID=A0A7S2IBS8_9DINO
MVPPAAPLAFAILKLLTVLAPRAWMVLNILSAACEAFAFWGFLQLLLNFIGGPTGDIPAVLERLGPVRVWRCSKLRTPTASDVSMVRALVYQFVVVVVAIAALELAEEWSKAHSVLLSVVDVASLIACVVAELSLMRMAHQVLGERHVHRKFWTLKALFVATTVSFRLANRLITADVQTGEQCYTSQMLAAAWSAGFTSVFAVVVAALAAWAFSPKDICDQQPQLSPATTDTSATAATTATMETELAVKASPKAEIDLVV